MNTPTRSYTTTDDLTGRNGLIAFELHRDTTTDPSGSCPTSDCENDRVEAVNPSSGRIAQVGICRMRECHDGSPAWSPGRGALAFDRRIPGKGDEVETRSADRYLIGIAHRDGSRLRTLYEPGVDPQWAPRARAFVYRRFGADDEALFVFDRDTGTQRRLAAGYTPWPAPRRR